MSDIPKVERQHGFSASCRARKPDSGGARRAFTLWGNIALQHLRAGQFWLNYMQCEEVA